MANLWLLQCVEPSAAEDPAAGLLSLVGRTRSGVSALASLLFTATRVKQSARSVIVRTQRLEFVNLDRLVGSIMDATARISQRANAVIESRHTGAAAS